MATRGRPFQPGNRLGRGRPAGSRNRTTRAAQELLENHAENLMRRCLADALQGDKQAQRLCLERLLPPCRERPVGMQAPPITTAEELSRAWEKLWKKMGGGQFTPGEAQTMASMLEGRRRAMDTEDLERRLRRLESGDDPS
jgi:hypothetical protein